ncbi:MAG: hypothetical protein ACLT2Z_09020 [Eubacterium sp.]
MCQQKQRIERRETTNMEATYREGGKGLIKTNRYVRNGSSGRLQNNRQ